MPDPKSKKPGAADNLEVNSMPAPFPMTQLGIMRQPVPAGNTQQPIDPNILKMLPVFLRSLGATMGKDSNPIDAIAHVPLKKEAKDVHVDRPKWFSKDVLSHELTHVFQNTREDAPKKGDDYYYGGPTGLLKAHQDGKNIATFTNEQQAQMVSDYYRINLSVLQVAKEQGGFLYPEQARWAERQRSAYDPFMEQLMGQPKRGDVPNPKSMPPEPRAKTPGLPSFEATGQLELNQAFVGTMLPIPVRSPYDEWATAHPKNVVPAKKRR